MLVRLDRGRAHANTLRGKGNLGQSEIQNFGVAAQGYKDVRWLDVAMNNTLSVCGFESIGNLDAQVEGGFDPSDTPAILCFSVTPSRYSMAMNACPCSSSIS